VTFCCNVLYVVFECGFALSITLYLLFIYAKDRHNGILMISLLFFNTSKWIPIMTNLSIVSISVINGQQMKGSE
jgi:hypothetical protein